jgi:hypothetical protein
MAFLDTFCSLNILFSNFFISGKVTDEKVSKFDQNYKDVKIFVKEMLLPWALLQDHLARGLPTDKFAQCCHSTQCWSQSFGGL